MSVVTLNLNRRTRMKSNIAKVKYKIIVFVMRMLLPMCRSISHGNNPQNILKDAMGDAGWYRLVVVPSNKSKANKPRSRIAQFRGV